MLARMGCVVFHYDMVGVADSKAIPHAAGFADAKAELHLQSAMGLQTFEIFIPETAIKDPQRVVRSFEETQRRLSEIPGVTMVAFGNKMDSSTSRGCRIWPMRLRSGPIARPRPPAL